MLTAILRLDYQLSFPTEVQLRQGSPRQKSLITNETNNDTKTTETERKETKVSEGKKTKGTR